VDERGSLRRRRRDHRRLGFGRLLTRPQAFQAAPGHQHRQHAVQDADLLRPPPVDTYARLATPVEGDRVAAARELEHQLEQLREDAGLGRTRDHADVEESIERRRGGRQAEEAAVGLHVRDRHERRVSRHRPVVDLDVDRVEGGLREPFDGHPIVREQAKLAAAGIPTRLLDGLLDPREQTEARV